jgi:hypothetical protein
MVRAAPSLLLLVALAGCSSGPAPRGLDDPDPAVRIRAIKREVARGTDADRRKLVEQLESEDPAVRLAAAEALRTLTGETRGFVWYEEPSKQSTAINAWRTHVGLPPTMTTTTQP